MRAVLLPLKDPAQAKQRLAGLLSQRERRRLFEVILEDVAAGLAGATLPDRVVVVTSAPEIVRYAREKGWEVLREGVQVSESRSVDWASRRLKEQGYSQVLRLPADIPCLRGEDVDGLFSLDPPPGTAVLVPSRDGTGTNALLRSPPDAFPSRFGENSLLRHHREAQRRQVELRVVENPRIALDLDEPADLAFFYRLRTDTRTHHFLRQLAPLAKTGEVSDP